MDWHQTLFEVIDTRSFSNLWFWIALAAIWSTASHRVIGVPWDMVVRAGQGGASAEAELEEMARVSAARLLRIAREAGLLMTVLGSFALTTLAVLGFAFGFEIAQAVFLLAAPMTLVGLLSLRTARRIQAAGCRGTVLRRRLAAHRRAVQTIGMAAILVTTMWGMYRNLVVGPFGG
ncbi:component of SufBCD complex [Roseivivax sp. CAU 1761]